MHMRIWALSHSWCQMKPVKWLQICSSDCSRENLNWDPELHLAVFSHFFYAFLPLFSSKILVCVRISLKFGLHFFLGLSLRKIQTVVPLCSHLKFWSLGPIIHRIMLLIINSENPDQTTPTGVVWSGSALFSRPFLNPLYSGNP